MARKPILDRPKSSKVSRTGLEKMQMNHQRTRQQITRIHAEAAERTATGKPLHAGHVPRR
jgi:hypothetical protein